MTVVRVVFLFVIVTVMVAAIAANARNEVDVDLLVQRTPLRLSVALVIVVAWAFGLLSYAVFALLGEIRLRARLARQRHENDLLMHELNELRNLPLLEDSQVGPKATERRTGEEQS